MIPEITKDLVQSAKARGMPLMPVGELNSSLGLNGGGTNKIQLIKFLRTVTNWGLKESKDYVESFNLPADAVRFKLAVHPFYKEMGIELFSEDEKARTDVHAAIKGASGDGQRILFAVATAVEAWEGMGFYSPLEAAECALNNLKRNGLK